MATDVYLDHNATAPLRPEAAEAVRRALAVAGNPSSVHGAGRSARRLVEDSRETLADLFGAPAAGVVFTSGGTEANNLALAGAPGRRVLVSAVEHDSVLSAVPEATPVPVDGTGRLDLSALADLLGAEETPALVSVMAANNETGAVQPVAEAAEIARRYGAVIHCDAIQAAPHGPLDMGGLGIHMMSLSAHKMGGPTGAGALLLAPGTDIAAVIRGGGQERGRRAGTENVPGIAGFGAAAAACRADSGAAGRLAGLRDDLERRLPDAHVHGADAPRLPNTACLGMPGMGNETQVMAFDLEGVAISAGAACSSGKVGVSHVLLAMGVDPAAAREAVRVSLGWTTTPADVDRFVAVWHGLYDRARSGRTAA